MIYENSMMRKAGEDNSMKKLPVGIDNFEKIRRENFYYVDKSFLIRDLLDNWGEVNLFTRPRRFGKTLNMSMLKSFFELGTDKTLFEGLAISEETGLCEKYMGKFPVVFISLKSVDGLSFSNARDTLWEVIQKELRRLQYLIQDDRLSELDRDSFLSLTVSEASDAVIQKSLAVLTELLYKYHDQKVIILIDEYDVPLDKAFSHGYYDEMVSLIRGLFGQALKTNEFLYFAVLTGCLRVSKESIFTGLNNFDVNSIVDVRHDEQFGFTEPEVNALLESYSFERAASDVKEWYDGYHFGDADVYCPWDVINYVKKLLTDPQAPPQAYWINTSGNELVRRFINKADKTTQNEIERLIAGETIEKAVRLDLTYNEIDNSIDNLWSVLFTTGYLTQAGRAENGIYKLAIPNREVREVFVLQIQEWFREQIVKDEKPLQALCQAFLDGNPHDIQKHLNIILGRTISILDTKARDAQKENFYHGILLGLLRSEADWLLLSNAESGDGFSDILIEPEDPDAGIIIEIKYASGISGLGKACEEAMKQIKTRRYDERLRNDGRNEIKAYGIAFCKKRCMVVCEVL
ncbi:MAG: AAA family ATPase [Lachnospiraceae bacterium]|nr:AAA family ATPase [Lachnospiraceae bacterium]